MALVVLLLMFLGGCQTVVPGSDPYGDCDHPKKPVELTDRSVALFILEQSETIDVCRALLGKEMQ